MGRPGHPRTCSFQAASMTRKSRRLRLVPLRYYLQKRDCYQLPAKIFSTLASSVEKPRNKEGSAPSVTSLEAQRRAYGDSNVQWLP